MRVLIVVVSVAFYERAHQCSYLKIKMVNLWHHQRSWWRGTVVERQSLAGELSLSCAQPAVDW